MMIEEPALLTIATLESLNRPTQAQIDAFVGVATGFICDALNGRAALHRDIAPLAPGILPHHLCGPALTVHSGPDDVLALFAALTQVQAGDVIVNATDGWQGSAGCGDRVLGMAKNGGATGFVTDGMMRDFEGIVDVGLPVFSTGLTPNSPFSKGPGSVGLPIEIGGRTVASGDMIVGDRDGVVVVPFARIDEVIEVIAHVIQLESDLDAKVAGGLKFFPDTARLVQSDQTKRIWKVVT
jgi:4-hydroxy-4-methyl-2-oxoglutarate aldolase